LLGISGLALPQATTLNVVVRNVVASLSIAVMTNVLAQQTVQHVRALARRAGVRVPPGATSLVAGRHVPAIVLVGEAQAYQDVFLLTGATILPALVLTWFLRQPPRRSPAR
jgi:hypothetical protein